MRTSFSSLFFALVCLSASHVQAWEWQCEGFGYAYSYKAKHFIYSPIQRFTIEKSGVPSDIAFRNDWNSYLRGEVRNLAKNDYQVVVTQDCELSEQPKGMRYRLDSVKGEFLNEGYSGHYLNHYSY